MSDVRTAGPASSADGPVPTPGGPLSYIHWGPAIAGAVVAAAVFFTFTTFASALALLSGVWILLVALGSFGLGGYLAGRVRSTWATNEDEREFRDGAHGLLVWALAILLGALLVGATATAIASVSAGTSSAQRASAGEPAFLSYELDRLFRSERRPDTVDPQARAEAGRLILRGIGRRGMAQEDRVYLARLVSVRTGLALADADRRVGQVLQDSRRAARRARASSVIVGFMTAASLAAGAAVAWFAACAGGQHRDRAISPPLRWSWRRAA